MKSYLTLILLLYLGIMVTPLFAEDLVLNFDELKENVPFETEDVHNYTIEMKSGQGISLCLKPTLNSGYLHLKLFNPDGVELAIKRNIVNGGTGFLKKTVHQNGTYKIRVSGSSARGIYTLIARSSWFNVGSTDDKRNFYHTKNTACYAKSGNYQVSYREDYFRFIAKHGGKISISIKPHMEGSLNFKIYNDQWIELDSSGYIYNDNIELLQITNKDRTGIFYLEVSSSSIGTYDLSISGEEADTDSDQDGLNDCLEYFHESNPYDSDSDKNNISDYDELNQGGRPGINIELPLTEVESANSAITAIPISDFNTRMNAIFSYPTVYSLNLYSGQIITVFLHAHLDNGLINFGIYKSGNELDSDYILNGENRQITIQANTDGVYNIKISGNSYSRGNYDFIVYDSWINDGAKDCERGYNSSYRTAFCAKSGNYFISDLHKDYFRFDIIENSSNVTFKLTPHLNIGSLDFSVLYEDGTEYARSSNIVDSQTGTENITFLLPGNYYIKVFGYGAFGNYDLSITGSGIASCDSGNCDQPNVTIKLDSPISPQDVNAGDQFTIKWSTTNASSSDSMIISMKRDSVSSNVTNPDNKNWYIFTDYGADSVNDGEEQITIPSGLSKGNDWRYYVRHIESNIFDRSDTFSLKSLTINGKIVVSIAGHTDLIVKDSQVLLQGTNSSAITDDNGEFVLDIYDAKNGDYNLIITSPELAATTKVLNLSGHNINLGNISMSVGSGSCSQDNLNAAALIERMKWDMKMDNKKGIEEAIEALKNVSGIY